MRRQTPILVAVLISCTLGLFLFPAADGQAPYPAVHGPVTTVRSANASAAATVAISRTDLTDPQNCLAPSRSNLLSAWSFRANPDQLLRDATLQAILRC